MSTEAVYDATLKNVKDIFPHYVRELEGVADGAEVDFHKVSSFFIEIMRVFIVFSKKVGVFVLLQKVKIECLLFLDFSFNYSYFCCTWMT